MDSYTDAAPDAGNEPVLLELTKRNFCYVMCNINFEEDPLIGYNVDKEKIVETFKDLNFEVIRKEDLSKDAMEGIFQEWNTKDFSDAQCIVCFILSHGHENGIIFGTDRDPLYLDEILSTVSRCEKLSGKPKLLFIQACRGDMEPLAYNLNEENNKKAGPKLSVDSKFHDTFVYYSTSEGDASYVHKVNGTVFIDSICNMFKVHSGTNTLNQLVLMINKKVSTTKNVLKGDPKGTYQAPEAVSTLHYDMMFHVKRNDSFDSSIAYKDEAVKPDERHCTKKNFCFLLTNLECCCNKTYNFEEDRKNIKRTFELLNFEVYQVENCKKDVIVAELKTLYDKDFSDNDCFVGVVLSCGDMSAGVNALYGTDGKFTSIDTMISKLSKVGSLHSKPKLLFMLFTRHSNRGKKWEENADNLHEKDDQMVKCDISLQIKSIKSDSFIFYATVEDERRGSNFISNLCQVLKEYSQRGYPLSKMVTKVNELCKISEQSSGIPEVCHTLTQDVFFKYVGAGTEEDNQRAGWSVASHPAATETYDKSTTHSFPSVHYTVQKPGKTMIENQEVPTSSCSNSSDLCADPGTTVESYPTPVHQDTQDDSPEIAFSLPGGTTSMLPQNMPQDTQQQILQMMKQMQMMMQNGQQLPQQQQQKQPEKKVRMLTPLQRERLVTDLDQIPLESWLPLGKEIFKGDKKLIAQVERLKIAYCGGGSPGNAFLAHLISAEVTTQQFINVAKHLRRNDIAQKLTEHFNKKMCELDGTLIEDLASLLDNMNRGVKNWEYFAARFDCCSQEDIDTFRVAMKDKGITSPTQSLLRLIETNKPNYKLSELSDDLGKIGRNDVKQYVDDSILS